MKNNNELAKEFAVWCWGKKSSSDVSKIESLFLTFCAEKEKDFEIVSFLNGDNNEIYKVCGDRFYLVDNSLLIETGNRSLTYCEKYYKINSVKRLSDGEIFNTDDFVTNEHNIKIRITEFNVVNEELRVFTDNDYSGWNFLKDLTKVKPILFTTLDGVEVFEGDVYWYFSELDNLIYRCNRANESLHTKLPFSTEIAAKNYKTENEKRFSLKDIKETVEKLSCFGTTLIEYLEKNGN